MSKQKIETRITRIHTNSQEFIIYKDSRFGLVKHWALLSFHHYTLLSGIIRVISVTRVKKIEVVLKNLHELKRPYPITDKVLFILSK